MTTKKSLVSLATGNVVNGIREIELSAIEPSQSIFFYPGDTILLYRNDFLCEDARFCQYQNDKLLPLGDIPGLAVESEGQFAVADKRMLSKLSHLKGPITRLFWPLKRLKFSKISTLLFLMSVLKKTWSKVKYKGLTLSPSNLSKVTLTHSTVTSSKISWLPAAPVNGALLPLKF
jgi:hypothetical protein